MNIKKVAKNTLYTINRNPISKYLFSQEISKRSKLPVTDIEGLAQHLQAFSPYTNEIHPPNDWYGHATALKSFLDLPNNYQFKFILEHGVYLTEQVDSLDIETNLPSIVTYCNYRANILKQYKDHTFVIGPFICYAKNYLNYETLKSERKRLGRTLLLFPNHASLQIKFGYNINELCKKVRDLGKKYDSVRVCLYWTDIIQKKHKIYENFGFECVTAGHSLDPNFLSRLRSIIETSDSTVSNCPGTHVGYCIALGKPHNILYQKFSIHTNKYWEERLNEFFKSKPFNEVLNEFSKHNDKVTPAQKKLVDIYWGTNKIKSKEELKKIVDLTEKIYQAA